MADEETVNVVQSSTLSVVDTPVSDPVKESSSDLKEKLSQASPVEPSKPNASPKGGKNVTTNQSPLQKPDTQSSDEIRRQIEGQTKPEDGDGKKDGSNEPAKQVEEVEDKSKWFDPERGFKTAEDMKKSYAELQNTFRQKSEEIKLERGKLELEQAQIKQEAEKLKVIENQRTLTPEETQRQEAIKQWEVQNKDALDLIESKIAERLSQRQQVEKSRENQELVVNNILKERNDWLDSFNKDTGRKALWPKMEQVFKEKGDTAEAAVQDFAKNPLPYIEAMAFHKNFPSIAEQIRAEAVEQYKAQVKEAAEVERTKGFARPGGAKTGTGDVDISKLSSSELGSLLQRNENG